MTKEISRQICEECGIDLQLDFSKPENFVKLLELELPSKWTLFHYFTYEGNYGAPRFGFTDRSNFLSNLLEYLKDDSEYAYEMFQVVSQENWVVN